MSENIPFFNDIPTKAIPAASRLFDTIRTPGFSFPVAYSDFVGDLNRLKVAPPARPVVKRWMAGVQGGLIARPSLHDEVAEAPAYFETLPETALAALQAAWYRARDKRFSVRSMLELFARDMSEIGCAPPSLPEMEGWINAVRGSSIPRPGRRAEEDISQDNASDERDVADDALALSAADLDFQPEPEAAFEKLTPVAFGKLAFQPLLEAGIAPPEPGDERPDPALALVARQMVEEEVARINMDVRARATATVAARLRQMAVSLEGGAA